MEDYVQMLLRFAEQAPDVFFQNAAFENAFKASMVALTLVHTDIVFAALELFRLIFTHDCLDTSVPPAPELHLYASAIHSVVDKEGYTFVGYVLTGLVGDFPEESKPLVASIVRSLAMAWPTQIQVWLRPVLQQLPVSKVPNEEKSAFLTDITRLVTRSAVRSPCSPGAYSAVNDRRYDKVKQAVNGLNRAAKRARDRRQVLENV
jgi:transportin-3